VKRSLAAGLPELEAARSQYGLGCAARVERVLASLRGQTFADAESLIAFHDALLFLRAFPQSRKVVILTEALLCRVGQQVKMLRDSGADLDLFDSEEFSGIAGTAIRDTFTYEVARWLALRFASELRVDWDLDEQSRQMSSSLPQQLPLLADDCLVEADTPYLDWLSSAAGGANRILSWLMQRLESSPRTILEKTAWYDALKIEVEWELGESAASRTHARRNPPDPYCHIAPLIRRSQVSLEEELASPPLPVRKLSRREGEEVMDLVRTVLTVRYRELYGTTRGDAEHVVEADVGRGVHIFLWGLPPDRRLPLRAYYAGMTVKNGVPINYIEGIGLFEWMEVGFNTFYAFRDGETAWIYSKVLHLLHQLAGITCFSVYPYQIGQDNEEAIKSGAFWFYRKLGFRPGKPELLALTEREEARIAKTPGYRTPARTLRKLAAEHVFYEFGDRAAWAVGWVLHPQHRLCRGAPHGGEVQGRSGARCGGCGCESLARELGTDCCGNGRALEQVAFADFALVLALVPEVKGWSSREKKSLAEIIRAKVGASEAEYLRLMQGHVKLKRAMLRLGGETKVPA
jgi:hypothetical protein